MLTSEIMQKYSRKAYLKSVPKVYGLLEFEEIEHNSSESARIGYNPAKGTFTAGYDGLYHFRTGLSIKSYF